MLLRHSVLKTSLAINFSSFDNYGYDTENSPLENPPQYTYANTPNHVLLGRLKAKTTLISLDSEIQFYFKDVIKYLYKYNKYRSKSRTNPYVNLGFSINYVNATPTYDQEALDNNAGGNNGYPDNYKASFIKETNTIALSGNLAFGARYKAGSNYDLFAQMNLKYFFSDWIDGVNPDPSNNNVNNFNSTISAGII